MMGNESNSPGRLVDFLQDLRAQVEGLNQEFARLGRVASADRRAHVAFLQEELARVASADSPTYYRSTHGESPRASNGREHFYIRPEEARFALMLLNALEVEALPLTERSPLFRTLGGYDVLYLWEPAAMRQLLHFLFGDESVAETVRATWQAVDRYQFRHEHDVLRSFKSEEEERCTKLRLMNFLLSLLVAYRDGDDPLGFVERFREELAPQVTAPMYYIEESPEMEQARMAARQTFGYFWREVYWDGHRKASILQHAIVKLMLRGADEEGDEVVVPVWVTVRAFDGETLRGRLLSSLHSIAGLEPGASMEFPVGLVDDWLFSAGGLAYGGFTVQYIRGQLSPAQRAQHDRDWGVDFPPLGEVRLAIGQEEHPEVLQEHPLSQLAVVQLRELLEADPACIAGRNGQGLTRLQQEALAGNKTLVEQLLAAGADPEERSAAGRTALDYAKQMGWWGIVSILKGE